MSPERVLSLFNGVWHVQEWDDFIDWDIGEAQLRKNTKNRIFTLIYDAQTRSFYSMLRRAYAEDADFDEGHVVPQRLTDVFVNMLSPEQLAACYRKSVALRTRSAS